GSGSGSGPAMSPPAAVAYAQPVAPTVYAVKPTDPRPSAKGMEIASMVLGICALTLGFFCWPVGIICAIVGLPLAWVSRTRISKPEWSDEGGGQATAGLVMNLIGVAFAVIGMIFIGGLFSALASAGG
ncbi:MAG: DUF4190 domain-containing protein, partial [Ilumatobacteraceae bacterium]